jgi:2-polyprenyl-3-methyl-5-hydroxy-6-metoxy-1,4-benzoquinol methylase
MVERKTWHDLEWDDEKAERFWDFAANWEPWQKDYFSKQVGSGIAHFLHQAVPLGGRILDYGCGPGYLVEELLKRGVPCEGLDSSPESVQMINRRFRHNPLWGGAKHFDGKPLPYEDNSFEAITCVETIEHVLPSRIGAFLSELRRILKPGRGWLFISTPHAENLRENAVYCPECGSLFHKYQHVSTFSAEKLRNLLEAHSLTTLLCSATDFRLFQQPWLIPPIDWSPRYLGSLMAKIWAAFLDLVSFSSDPMRGRLLQRRLGRGPHLFWLGGKE